MRFFLSVLFALSAGVALACGPDSHCPVGADRHYRISSPELAPNGAIVFAHGFGGSAEGTMRNRSMRAMVADMGLAFIALKSFDKEWSIPNAPGHPDADGSEETDYVASVLADAAARFDLDPDRVMLTGFSAGAMMVWHLACARPDLFAGFVPVAGTFWDSAPATCRAPASVIHIHGMSDKTVPLEGRKIKETHQGSVPDTLAMYRSFGGFVPVEEVRQDAMTCTRDSNDTGAILEFCSHPGGHSFSRTYLQYGWNRLVATGRI